MIRASRVPTVDFTDWQCTPSADALPSQMLSRTGYWIYTFDSHPSENGVYVLTEISIVQGRRDKNSQARYERRENKVQVYTYYTRKRFKHLESNEGVLIKGREWDDYQEWTEGTQEGETSEGRRERIW